MSNVFKIIFQNDNKLFEIFAKNVYQSDMFGFIEIEEILFGEQSTVLVDPSEEKLKTEFSHVVRSFIPMQSIIRIDEVPKQATSKIREIGFNSSGGNITQFPGSNNSHSRSHIKPKE